MVDKDLAANRNYPVAVLDRAYLNVNREMEERLIVFECAAILNSLLSQGRHCPPETIENARAELIWRNNALISIPGKFRRREQW